MYRSSARTAKSGRSKDARDRGWRVDREQPSSLNESDAIAAVGFVHVRRGDDDGQAGGLQAAEQIPELTPRHRIDASRRLVEQEDIRAVHERAAERQLLLHAARERAGASTLERLELRVDGRDLFVLRAIVVPNTDAKKRRFSSTLKSG